jgi:hypothetical protein
LVQTYVGPGRLAAKADTPLAGILLPQREIGVDERKWKLLRSVLEIDARIGGFKVRERSYAARA